MMATLGRYTSAFLVGSACFVVLPFLFAYVGAPVGALDASYWFGVIMGGINAVLISRVRSGA